MWWMNIVWLFSRFIDIYPITSQDDEVVFSRDVPLSDFRDRDQSILFNTIVSERSWHSQSRCFCVWLPYTVDSWLIFHTEYTSIASDNSLLLLYFVHTKTNTNIKIQELTRIIFIYFSRSIKVSLRRIERTNEADSVWNPGWAEQQPSSLHLKWWLALLVNRLHLIHKLHHPT